MSETTAIEVLREFVADVTAAYPDDEALNDLEAEWPDLMTTFVKAKAVLKTPDQERTMPNPLVIIAKNISWDTEDLDPEVAQALPSETTFTWDDISSALKDDVRVALKSRANMDLAAVVCAHVSEALTERFNCCHFGADITAK
jgi:hypothetical protein